MDLAELEMLRDPEAVSVEAEEHLLPKADGERSAVEESESPDPADRPQRHVHRAGPVDADPGGVLPYPGPDLRLKFRRQARIALDDPGAAERRQVLAARELPRDLDVALARELRDVDGLGRDEVPPPARLEIAAPVDVRSQGRRAGAQEIELVRQDLFDAAAEGLPLRRVGPGIERADRVAIGRGEAKRSERLAAPQVRQRDGAAASRHLRGRQGFDVAAQAAGPDPAAKLVEPPARQVSRGFPGAPAQQLERLQATRASRRLSTQRSNHATAL